VNSSNLVAVVATHLWQSTLFAAAVACLTLLLRRNSARIRYCLWLAASAKFLVPFALLSAMGAWIPVPLGSTHGMERSLISVPRVAMPILHFGGEGLTALAPVVHLGRSGNVVPIALAVLWTLGALAVAARWLAGWLRLRRALRESTPADLPFVTPVRSCSSQLEPAVVGVLRPVLLIPQGLEQRLTSEEMRAILAHERCHVAWWDNRAAALHMVVETLFWFHPLIWWLGRRLVDERERACDEQVLADGHPPESYAEGILKVCEQYLQSGLACAAGISGADLRHRIDAIIRNSLVERLNAVPKLLISLTACATIVVPLAAGMLTSAQARAQPEIPTSGVPAFSNLIIRIAPAGEPSAARPCAVVEATSSLPPGRVRIGCPSLTLRPFIAGVYGVSESQVIGQDWSKEPHYDITADSPLYIPNSLAENPEAARRAVFLNLPTMMRNMLAKQFGLVVKRERRQMDGYVLSISLGGSKLKPYAGGPSWKTVAWGTPEDGMIATDYPVSALSGFLQGIFRVPVVDQTGLKGHYEYRVDWKPTAAGVLPDPATVATALERQLGLRLEAKPVTVEVINVLSLKSPDEVMRHN
jgi:bla regulator protein blaR1